jgi:hypothetical protein
LTKWSKKSIIIGCKLALAFGSKIKVLGIRLVLITVFQPVVTPLNFDNFKEK